jgi:predicted Zn finger-like uncharacterized protein
MSLPSPGSDPGTFARCNGCGDRVQPGAFLCPHCQTGLQVQRSLLPTDGGNGRCPECSETVWVPPLALENFEADATSHVLGDEAQETVAPESFLDSSEEAHSHSAADPADWHEEAPSGRPGRRLFLGSALGAGAAVGIILSGVWVPPELPWHTEFAFANLISWAGFFGLGGALLALLLGGNRRS